MARLQCYGGHMFSEECVEFCTEEQRKQCYLEKELEKTKIKTSWLQPS